MFQDNPLFRLFTDSSIVQPRGGGFRPALLLLLFTCVMTFSLTARAQTPGAFDPSFSGRVGVNGGTVFATKSLSNGKVMVVGDFQQFNNFPTVGIARLNADGSVDTTFQVVKGPNGPVKSVAAQTDGKLLIAGPFLTFNGEPVNQLIRLNPDGTRDATFSPAPIFPSSTPDFSILVQPDGNILFSTGSRIHRFRPNGANDPAFNAGSPLFEAATAIALQSDGQILVGRQFSTATFGVRRYSSTGGVDGSFSPRTNNPVTAIFVQSDGKILIGGNFTVSNNVGINTLARLNSDGTQDAMFSSPFLTPANDEDRAVFGITTAINGTIYAIGRSLKMNTGTFKVVNLNQDGTITFESALLPQPAGNTEFYTAIETQANFRVLLSGNFVTIGNFLRPGILRILAGSTIDSGFNPGVGALTQGSVTATAVQRDARILIGGNFTAVSGQRSIRLARLLLDGVVDTSFSVGTGFELDPSTPASAPPITDIGTQSTGDILVVGNFSRYSGVSRAGFARLKENGALDTTFSPAVNGTIFKLTALPDDRILIVGNFTTVNATTRNGVARLNADGSVDQSFNPAIPPGSSVQRAVPQTDGRVIVALSNSVFRLKTDGAADTSFAPVSVDGVIQDIVLQSDSRILIGGGFSTVNGGFQSRIARLNPDGSLDSEFAPLSFVSDQVSPVKRIAVQSDGKVIAAGVPSNGGPGIVRLNPNGSLDASFNPGLGLELAPINGFEAVSIDTLNILPSRRILLGGKFDFFDSKNARSLATLQVGPVCQYSISPTSAFFPQSGGNGNLTITVQGGCDWQALGIPSWITGFPNAGTGTQTVSFTVAPNGGAARRANISINGQSFKVVQGDSCSFTIAPSSTSLPFQGGSGTLTITASTPSCEWSVLDLPDWITGIPTDGVGTQTLTFSVAANAGLARSATLNISGQLFTVSQAANPCPFTVTPLELFTTGKATSKTITVTTNSGCTWRASSSVTWIGVVGTNPRSGSGTVTFVIAANPDVTPGSTRVGVVVVAGQAVIITQRAGRFRTTIGVQRPSDSKFYLRYSPTTGFAEKEFIYGAGNDIPLSGDWDGDGVDSVGIYRNGVFFLKNKNEAGNADLSFPYGQFGDIAVSGDWDGDGIDTIGVFRNGVFFLRNTNTAGPADIQVFFGQTGDIPVAGDWDGNGVDSVGIFRNGVFFLRNSNTSGFADIQVPFGLPTDRPIVGDWDGDGTDTIGVYRNGEYYMRNFNTTGPFNILAYYGTAADVPIRGDWTHE